jgi:hypothetical protein
MAPLRLSIASLRIMSLGLVGACAVGLSPMIDYSTLRTERQARFFVDGEMIVVQAYNPQGENLALEPEPQLYHGKVVLVAGVASSGAAGVKTYCRDIGPLSPPPDWPNKVFWRNRSGELVHIQSIVRGEAARQLVAKCRRLSRE